jgi:Xaa-Pro aminopeptidase
VADAILMAAGSFECGDMLYALGGYLVFDPVIYLEVEGRVTVVVSELDRRRAMAELRRASEVWSDAEFDADGWPALTLAVVRRVGLDRVTVPGWYPAALADHLRAGGVEVVADEDLIARRRRHKRPDEIAAISDSLRVAERSLSHARSLLAASRIESDGTLSLQGRPLTSELVQGEIRSAWSLSGCEGDVPVVAGGPQGAHVYEMGGGVLRAGEPLLCDLFPRHSVSRYYADITRVFCVGEPPDKLCRVHEAVRGALEFARQTCRSGMPGNRVFERVCEYFGELGYTPTDPLHPGEGVQVAPYLGHGLGLDVHEMTTGPDPSIPFPLETGDVVTIEPCLYQYGWGAVRLEDVVVITEDGCETLTRFDYDLSVVPSGS